MEDAKGLLAWALAQRQSINLKVQELTWPQKVFGNHSNFDIQISLDNHDFSGIGFASEPLLALEIAITEALERYRFSKLHSDYCYFPGTAAHPNAANAIQSAVNELVERDSFLHHFYSNRPFFRDETVDDSASRFERVVSYTKQNNLRLEVRRMLSPANTLGVVAACFGNLCRKPFGVTLGTACKTFVNDPREASEAATRSALFECLRNAVSWIDNANAISYTRADFESIANPLPTDHMRLYRHPSMAKVVNDLFVVSTEALSESATLDIKSVAAELCAETRISGSPTLFFAHANSRACLSLKTFHDGPSSAHIERLSLHMNRLKIIERLSLPYPIG